MASQQFLWKPQSESDGRLVVLLPNRYTGKAKSVTVVLPDGQKVSGRFTGSQKNGQRGHYRFNQPGQAFPKGSYVEAELEGGETVQWQVGDPSTRNVGGLGAQTRYTSPETAQPTSLPGSRPGSGGAPPPSGGGGGGEGGNNVEFIEGDPGYAYPQADASGLTFTPITPTFIPQIQVPFVDPIEAAGRYGDFNTQQFQQNLETGGANALGLLQLEFAGLQAYNRAARGLQQEGIAEENVFNQTQVAAANRFNRGEIPAANEFNRGEISTANRFNQDERIAQLEEALPGARDVINRQIERGATLAEGRFPNALEDRAFEAAARNASADQTVVRGFGDDSVFGRRASDLLSAEQRLRVSQVGEQTLDRFLSLGANLAFDQPIKFNPIIDQPLRFTPQQATTAQDVRGAPARPASELAIQQQGALNQLTTVTPSQGIQFEVGQNQYQAGLSQRTNEFNSQLDFNSQAFNSSTGLQVDLEKLYAETFNAQQEANAINAGIGFNQAQQGFGEGQDQSTLSSIGEFAGDVVSAIQTGYQIYDTFFKAAGAGPEVAGGGSAGAEAAGAAELGPASQGGGGAGAGAAGAGAAGAGGAGVAGAGAAGAGVGGGAAAGAGAGVGGGAAGIGVGGGIAQGSLATTGTAAVSGGGTAAVGGGGTAAVGGGATGTAAVSGGGATGTAATGAATAGATPVAATVVGGLGAAAIAGFAAYTAFDHFTGGKKSGAQKARDSLRSHGEGIGVFTKGEEIPDFESKGLVADHHYVELADGTQYDIGVDGGEKLQNYSTNIDGKTERHTFEIDWSDPRAGDVVGYLNPAATILFGPNSNKIIGHLWNSVTSNNGTLSESKENIRHMVEQAGIDYDTGVRILKQMRDYRGPAPTRDTSPVRTEGGRVYTTKKDRIDYSKRGYITDEEYNAYLNGWNELMQTESVPQEIAV